MLQVKFEEIKPEIETALPAAMRKSGIYAEEGGFTLVDGFLTMSVQSEIAGSVIIGGPSVPVIAIVGKASGRMYFFALKALLPHLNI